MEVINIKNKIKVKFKIILILSIIILSYNTFIYILDKTVTPTALAVADSEMRARASEIVNKAIINVYSKQFNYDEIIRVDKDSEGNIVMLKADTLKMNKIASDVALEIQKELFKLGEIGIKIPIGYITRNNILSYYGPAITIKMRPIGIVETKYSSEFESAGINQTRHKIYVKVKTTVKVSIPMKSNYVEVANEIPIAETIIVGKTPNTAIGLDLNATGTKIGNK